MKADMRASLLLLGGSALAVRAQSQTTASPAASGTSTGIPSNDTAAATNTDRSAVSTSTIASTRPNAPAGSYALPTVYTAPAQFPSGVFASFYSGFEVTQTSAEPQPKVTNPVNGKVYGLNLTNADTQPDANNVDPVILPGSATNQNGYNISATANLSTADSIALRTQAIAQVQGIITSNSSASNCTKCQMGLQVAQGLALKAPWEVPNMLVSICQQYKFASPATCVSTYSQNALGGVITQVAAYANLTVGSYDGQAICARFINSYCPPVTASPLNMTGYFAKPKPSNAVAPAPGGKTVKVAHISDFHLDPRYKIGSESNCTSGLCCQSFSPNAASPNKTTVPAPRFGAFACDTPYDLAGAVINAIPTLLGTGTNATNPVAFTLYTGDLVTHLTDNRLSQELVMYTEDSVYTMLKYALGGTPLYAALGNHDSYNDNMNSQNKLPGITGRKQYSWNYDHVSKLWQTYGFINSTQQIQAAEHYGGYSVVTPLGLKIITINTDFWYRSNYFNYINMTDPDLSGMLAFLRDELQAAEDAGQRVWIVGHVVTGWSGSNPLPNPTNLFYQIVDRYSPHVIANIFFGHTHEDQFNIFYANNGTNTSAATAQAVSWMGPSVTPLTNLNSGFRYYEVDTVSFDVMNSHTFYTNVSAFPALDSQNSIGPTFNYEYNARDAYGGNISWPTTAPLNATWWHKVTEQMEKDPSLIQKFRTYQGKTSVRTTNCTSTACLGAQVCYMRSGSNPIGQKCTQGFDSVQGS